MAEKAQATAAKAGSNSTGANIVKKGPGHRPVDARDAIAELTERAQEISLEADFLCALRELGDGIACIDGTVPRAFLHYVGAGGIRPRLRCSSLSFLSHLGQSYSGGTRRGAAHEAGGCSGWAARGKYMIQRKLRKRCSRSGRAGYFSSKTS